MMDNLKILKSKLTIKRAMLELLTEKPFEHITIKDISDKAMVGRSKFYYHYLDKYDLVDNLIKDSLEDYEKTLHQRLTELHVDIEHFLSTLEHDSKTLLLLRQGDEPWHSILKLKLSWMDEKSDGKKLNIGNQFV